MSAGLYLVTRRDMAPGYQAVQSCHALRQFVADHPTADKAWFEGSNRIVLLAVEDEPSLASLATEAAGLGLLVARFREPDVGDQLTAIAIQPHDAARKLCKRIPLALSM